MRRIASAAAAKSVPQEASVACSTKIALEWDADHGSRDDHSHQTSHVRVKKMKISCQNIMNTLKFSMRNI